MEDIEEFEEYKGIKFNKIITGVTLVVLVLSIGVFYLIKNPEITGALFFQDSNYCRISEGISPIAKSAIKCDILDISSNSIKIRFTNRELSRVALTITKIRIGGCELKKEIPLVNLGQYTDVDFVCSGFETKNDITIDYTRTESGLAHTLSGTVILRGI